MVVPVGPGGGSDVFGRAVAAGLEGVQDGLNVSVENREGGASAVGYSYFQSRAGSPNYLIASDPGGLLTLPLTGDVPYDYTSFTPIMKVGEDATMLVVSSESPYQSCNDVVEAAKSEEIFAGITGAMGIDNVVFTLTEQDKDVQFERVPFESGAELLAALLGGQVAFAALNPSEILGQIQSGDVRPLCVYADERYEYEDLKDVPTAKEEGIDVAFSQYRGILAPGDISKAEQDAWIEVFRDFAETDAYTEYIETNYLLPSSDYGDDFAAYLEETNAALEMALG
jgi:putative tricarboxylic transport membrane protein